jgi:acid phosphatase family membrane protein YuiD
MLKEVFSNHVLIVATLAWIIGQFLKFPLDAILNKRLNWGVMLSAGGLPSSHSALVVAVTLSIGLHDGFGSSLFALAAAVTMIVIYDAAGVRRQAGIHAERINQIMKTLFESGQIPEKELKEMIGHTPFEVIAGVILGIAIALVAHYLLPF